MSVPRGIGAARRRFNADTTKSSSILLAIRQGLTDLLACWQYWGAILNAGPR